MLVEPLVRKIATAAEQAGALVVGHAADHGSELALVELTGLISGIGRAGSLEVASRDLEARVLRNLGKCLVAPLNVVDLGDLLHARGKLLVLARPPDESL